MDSSSPHNKNDIVDHNHIAADSSNSNWYEVRLTGKVPERRGYHSDFIHNNKLYIYGGHDIREGSMDNLWVIDLENFDDLDLMPEDQDRTCEWKLLPTKGSHTTGPGAISHHTSVVFGDKMYLFGGSKGNGEENKHLFALNIEK